jgi:hypothetical protein
MDNLLILFIETNYELSLTNVIESYKNCFVNNKKICLYVNDIYDSIQNNYNQIEFIKIDKLTNNLFDIKKININDYKYVFYINNEYINSNIDYINISKLIFENNKEYNQIIFNNNFKEDITINIDNNTYTTIKLNTYDYNNKYSIFNKIKSIFKSDVRNNYEINNQEINYNEYINKKWDTSYFKLDLSIIKIEEFIKLQNFPLIPYTYDTKIISKQLLKTSQKSIYYKTLNILNNKLSNIINNKNNDMTIVTGFYKTNRVAKKHSYEYLDKSIKTLSIPQNMYIFITSDLKDFVLEIRKKLNLLNKTKIIEITYNNLYMIDYYDKIAENTVKNNAIYMNPLYIMCVASRNNYLRSAINDNFFNTDFFIWVDFGLSHIVEMNDMLLNINNYNQIRIAWISRYKKNKNLFVYNHECMGGGLFGGHKNILLKLINLHDEYFIKLTNMGFNMNNDKLLFLMFEEYPELFDYYFSSYNLLYLKFN